MARNHSDDSPRPIEIIPAFAGAPQKEVVHPRSLLVRLLLLEEGFSLKTACLTNCTSKLEADE